MGKRRLCQCFGKSLIAKMLIKHFTLEEKTVSVVLVGLIAKIQSPPRDADILPKPLQMFFFFFFFIIFRVQNHFVSIFVVPRFLNSAISPFDDMPLKLLLSAACPLSHITRVSLHKTSITLPRGLRLLYPLFPVLGSFIYLYLWL